MNVITWDLLKSIGFKEDDSVISDPPGGLSIDFGNCELSASFGVTRWWQQNVMLSGVMSDSRRISGIQSEMPLEVESWEQGVAWVTWCLDQHSNDHIFNPAFPVKWLIEGRQNFHLLPWEKKRAAAMEKEMEMNKPALFSSENLVVSYDDLVKKVIGEINDMPYDEMLSGDRFLNFWEEFAFQVQIEESYCFHVYEEVVRAFCEALVEELPKEAAEFLWEKSDACFEWDCEDGEPSINIQRDGVTEELIQKVYNVAADYQLPSYLEDEEISDSNIIYGRKDFEYNEAVEKIIIEIRSIPKSSMQSGDDSPYEDVWEEYSVQVQGEESFTFELYEDLVKDACHKFVLNLTKSNLSNLWKESESFIDWDDESEPDDSEMEEAVAQELFQQVANAAADYVFSGLDEEEGDEEDDDEDDGEECEEDTNGKFKLEEEDYDAIRMAQDVIRLLLSERRLTAQQVVGLGHALYALEMLPEVTPGIYCNYAISYRTGNEKFNETRCILFLISEEEFEISTGGGVYDQSVGGDSISGPGWRIEIGGFVDRALGQGLYKLENTIREYLNLGAEIRVNDSSGKIEFE